MAVDSCGVGGGGGVEGGAHDKVPMGEVLHMVGHMVGRTLQSTEIKQLQINIQEGHKLK